MAQINTSEQFKTVCEYKLLGWQRLKTLPNNCPENKDFIHLYHEVTGAIIHVGPSGIVMTNKTYRLANLITNKNHINN